MTAKLIVSISFSVFLAGLAFSLFQIEEADKANFLAKQYSSEISDLVSQTDKLQDDYLKEIASINLDKKAEKIGFVKVNNVRYIPVANDYLAERNY